MSKDFLFEIGLEELPSGSVLPLAEELEKCVAQALKTVGLSYTKIQSYATPRRVALLLSDLAEEEPSRKVMKRGPAAQMAYDKEGKPSQALLGFARSVGVEYQELKRQETEKGDFFYFEMDVTGMKTTLRMPELLETALNALTSFKPMRWGEGHFQFARPVHWIVMIYGQEVVPARIFGMHANRLTYGHRFHHNEPISIAEPKEYAAVLEQAFVVADFAKRRERIITQVEKCAADLQAQAIMPESLIDEVCSIVEWPEALLASFDKTFLTVPKEALIAAMQVHQKCFALQSKEGALLPHFITVSNIQSLNPEQVIAGNEKVMHARLSDAAFFFEQDKKIPFALWEEATKKVVFQNRLGSLFDKAKRVGLLARDLARALDLPIQQAQRAADLSKCDLMSGMVGEFPELQGLMGYYYALDKGELPSVAEALHEQYYPRFSKDDLPKSPLGMVLSLADRLDTLVGIFGIGLKPTGVKDPFKLRRQALAIGRLLIAIPNPLNLASFIQKTHTYYGSLLTVDAESLVKELTTFIFERLIAYYQAYSISADKVQAVQACQSEWLYDFDKRLNALNDFVERPEALALAASCKRVGNILKTEPHDLPAIDPHLFLEPAEVHLHAQLTAIEMQNQDYYREANYQAILESLSTLRTPVDQFFDMVMVMVPDEGLKQNRLSLLKQLQRNLKAVADISLLQI